jgi:hypothetical protein
VLLAELEIWHSRPIAPTRRVALGRTVLPVEPAPGFGGLLLGGIVAGHIGELDDDMLAELEQLVTDLEAGRRIAQPRLHHRFQLDRHGLARSRHRLHGEGDALDFDFEGEGSPASQVLGAAYAAGQLDPQTRRVVMAVIRQGMQWRGPIGPGIIRHLTGVRRGSFRSSRSFADPALWARTTLGFDAADSPPGREVQRRFRSLLRAAHPDHGGDRDGAADRIADLTEARRILLRS